MRAWYQKDMALGLLYSCTLGHVRPDCPLALIQNRRADGTDFMEVVPCEHQMPGQREQARPGRYPTLCRAARASHPLPALRLRAHRVLLARNLPRCACSGGGPVASL